MLQPENAESEIKPPEDLRPPIEPAAALDAPDWRVRARARWRFVRLELVYFAKNLVHEFIDKGCQKNAAALTYMTLFALVPMITVIYSILSMIPFFNGAADQLLTRLFANLVPETGSQLKGYLSDFSTQARNLTGVGVLMLFVTAFLMLTNIEKTFNGIWGVRDARKGLSSFLLYWAVLSIGPLMLAAGLSLTTYVLSMRLLVEEFDYFGISSLLLEVAPLAMSATVFTLLFAAVPNCRVPLKFALVGGLVTAICFELLKSGFGALVANSSFNLIYGAFAVVPLFLLWINLLWMTVLAGAVFVRALSEQAYVTRKRRLTDIRAILHCLALLHHRAQTGARVSDEDCVNIGISLVHWQYLRTLLVRNNWIVVTQSGSYALCRDLKSVSLWDLAELVQMPIGEPVPERAELESELRSAAWLDAFLSCRTEVQDYARERFSLPLETLFEHPELAFDTPRLEA